MENRRVLFSGHVRSLSCVAAIFAAIGVFNLLTKTICRVYTRDGRYQKFDDDAISICKASIYRYITIFITVWTFSLNLCKCIKYIAFCFKFLCFGDFNLPFLLETATL